MGVIPPAIYRGSMYYNTVDNHNLCNASRDSGLPFAAYILIAIVMCIVLFCYSAKKYKPRVWGKAQAYYLITEHTQLTDMIVDI